MSKKSIQLLLAIIILYVLGIFSGYAIKNMQIQNDNIEFSGDIIESGETYLYTTENVDVRVAPNTNAEIKTILPKDSQVIQVLPKDSLWETIRISGDASGEYYIYKEFLTDTLIKEGSGDTNISGDSGEQTINTNTEVEAKQVSTSNLNKTEIQKPKAIESTSVSAETDELFGYFTITYYCACNKCCGPNAKGITASGTKVQAGRTIAASSKYPFGTQMNINGHVYTVEDRGGAINGNKIDIYVDSHSEALRLGRQTNIPVYKVQ